MSLKLYTTAIILTIITIQWMANSCQHSRTKPIEKVKTYGTGTVSSRYYEIDGKIEGKMIDYYPEGQVKAERWFKQNQQTGRTRIYYPSGKIQEVQYYQNGKKQGGDTIWYENGQIQFVLNFEQEKKNGYLRKWTPEGKLVVEALYQMDTLVEVKGKSVRSDAEVSGQPQN